MRSVSTIGIDIAKSVYFLCFMDEAGKVVKRKCLSRGEFLPYLSKLPACLIGMEACGGAHHWGRELTKFGFEVKLMPPKYVKAYVKTNKSDQNDAEGCSEAVN